MKDSPDYEKLYESLKKDFDALRSDFDALRSDAAALGNAGAAHARHRVQDGAEALSEKARAAVGHGADEAQAANDELRKTVAANPLTSVGAALAVGVMLGRGLFRD